MVIAATAGPAAAQADRPGKSAPKSKQSSPITTPIVFYAAKGQPDACGPGCSEWIAAEGQFDVGAPQRLRTFLARHSASTARTDAPSDGRKLPIFFHSSGGLQDQAIAIGRLLREREMTAGVSRTIPAGCVGASDEACRALKQSGKSSTPNCAVSPAAIRPASTRWSAAKRGRCRRVHGSESTPAG